MLAGEMGWGGLIGFLGRAYSGKVSMNHISNVIKTQLTKGARVTDFPF